MKASSLFRSFLWLLVGTLGLMAMGLRTAQAIPTLVQFDYEGNLQNTTAQAIVHIGNLKETQPSGRRDFELTKVELSATSDAFGGNTLTAVITPETAVGDIFFGNTFPLLSCFASFAAAPDDSLLGVDCGNLPFIDGNFGIFMDITTDVIGATTLPDGRLRGKFVRISDLFLTSFQILDVPGGTVPVPSTLVLLLAGLAGLLGWRRLQPGTRCNQTL
ncbi:MAG: PEP-CTERM sorting domain-containing protein [Alphaproteobacteria bacterium]|nr:MAG: PEP-CTERM sorting domain-containing protein [Alphaproteobacteria bacterium]